MKLKETQIQNMDSLRFEKQAYLVQGRLNFKNISTSASQSSFN